MSQIEQILEELKLAFEGEPWHGPSVMEILEGIDVETAAARPISGAHSIWELVLHIAAWEFAINTRIVQKKPRQLSDDENFPKVSDINEAAWQQAVENLRQNHQELLATVSAMTQEQLGEQVPGKSYDIRFMLHGAAQHAAYHGGQISLLKMAAKG